MSNIEIKNLSKTFDGNVVLSNVNLEIKSGESFVIIGGSGSGKSVLIKCIAGLLLPDSGSQIIIDGADYSKKLIAMRSNFTELFGMSFQGGALFDSMSIWQNITFQIRNSRKITKAAARAIALEKLELVGLDSTVLDKYPIELSGGMQKRAAMARAIAHDPKLLFFDEPTAGLDPIMTNVIAQLIRKLGKKLNATTLTITHDMNCVSQIADNIAMIQDGTIIWQGTDINNVKDKRVSNFCKGIAV
jgi:phospholipid/cholesterol/gamma-HCH transport system ATP-binding protein